MAWSGGAWGNEVYPVGDPAVAPHVVMRELPVIGLYAYDFSVALAGPEGPAGTHNLEPELMSRVWIPTHMLYGDKDPLGRTQPIGGWVENPTKVNVIAPDFDERLILPFGPLMVFTDWLRGMGIEWEYHPEYDPLKLALRGAVAVYATVEPSEHVLAVEHEGETVPVELTAQHIVVGGLRAIYAHEMDWRPFDDELS